MVFLRRLPGGVTDLLVRETHDGVHQNTFINEEGVPRHLLKLLERELRQPVRYELKHVVLPCDGELNEVHQVSVALTGGAGLVSVSMAERASLPPPPLAAGTSVVSGPVVTSMSCCPATMSVAERTPPISPPCTVCAARPTTAVAPVTRLYKGGVRDTHFQDHIDVSLWLLHRDVPRRWAHPVLRSVYHLA